MDTDPGSVDDSPMAVTAGHLFGRIPPPSLTSHARHACNSITVSPADHRACSHEYSECFNGSTWGERPDRDQGRGGRTVHEPVAIALHTPALQDEAGVLKKDYTYDGLHPNNAGYDAILPAAEKAIAQALSAP